MFNLGEVEAWIAQRPWPKEVKAKAVFAARSRKDRDCENLTPEQWEHYALLWGGSAA